MTNPGLRVSDADRQRAISALERHTAAGRLSLDEFGERVGAALRAATRHDLDAVTADLPADPAAAGQVDEETLAARRANTRQLLIAFALAIVTLIALGTVLALGR